MATARVSFLQHKDYQAVSIAHFFVDVLNSSRSLVVAILAVSIGLSNVQVAIALLLYNIGNALTQPLFGHLADRSGPRWLVIGGLGWMIFFFTLAAIAPPWPALAALTVAGLGSGAFHPTGTMVASEASHQHRTQATSIFFMAGQIGLFAGPVMAGLLLSNFGRSGYIILPALALLGFISAWKWLFNGSRNQPNSEDTDKTANLYQHRSHLIYRRAILISIIILCMGTVSAAAINFSPKLFTELGFGAAYVGLLSGLFMLGSAVGGVAGGMLSDRWNGRVVILLAATASILPVLFYIPSAGIGRFVLLLTAGFFIGMPHSVLVLMVQGLLPGQRAMASGLALGFMFFSGSLGTLAVGMIADTIGLDSALRLTALLPIITIVATLLLPRSPQAEPS
jgi:FSR family fosmidomycin resistance protein-like MFS transporter